MTDPAVLRCATSWRERCVIVRPDGELTSLTYGSLRDTLVKLALDLPRAVIAEIDALRISAEPALTVFSSVWQRVGDWPGVPIIVVAGREPQRSVLARSPVRRFVPIFHDIDAAVASLRRPPRRRSANLELPPLSASSRHARRFVRQICARWQCEAVTTEAMDIATELVENSVRHAGTPLRLRLELRNGLLTIAVSDEDPREAVLREPGVGDGPLHTGLHLLSGLARR